MRWAFAAGSTWLTLGLAPLAGMVPGPLLAARRSTTFLYDFDGLRRYKAKLRPRVWAPIFLAHAPTQGALVSLLDALVAFTRGGFLRFGLRSVMRGPTAILRILTLLLGPWVLLLSLAPAEHWFGTPWVKWSWVLFDVVLAFGLCLLLRRPRRWLVSALAIAVSVDAALTLLQAVYFNLRQARGALEYAVIGLACAAPAFAALVLWGARHTRFRAL